MPGPHQFADADQYRGYDFDPVVGLYLPGRGLALDAEAWVSRMAPRHWYRADTYTLSGGNLATLPNRNTTVGGAMVVAAGTIAAPSTAANLGGRERIEFTGTQRLLANHAASEFSYLHGPESDTFMVFRNPHSSTGTIWSTGGSGGATGVQFYILATSGNRGYVVRDGVNQLINSAVAPASGANSDTYMEWSMSAGGPQFFQTDKDSAIGSGALSATFTPGAAPGAALTVGAYINGITPATFSFAEVLSFNRRLTPYERQLVREYIALRYGIAAPVWSAEDRAILQLNPFSWIRADYYSTSAGKVSAFLDKVLPGHSMVQGTSGNQVNDPTVDATLGGKLSANFVAASAHNYSSNLAESAWRFLGNGGPFHAFSAWVPTATGNNILFATGILSGGGTDTGCVHWYTNSSMRVSLTASGVSVVDNAVASSLAIGTGAYAELTYQNGGSPEVLHTYKNTTLFSGADTGVAPGTGAAASTLRIGTTAVTGVAFSGRRADQLIFNRRLSASERATVQNYLARYGL